MNNKLLILASTLAFFQISFTLECNMSRIMPYRNTDNKISILNNKQIDCSKKQKISGSENYYKDDEGVFLDANGSSLYAGWVWLEMLDPDTAVYLDADYIKDDKYVYNYAKLIEGADSKTFEILSDNLYYSKDSVHVYFRGTEIERANPVTFKILKGLYAKDNKNIYYEKTRLDKAKVKTFKVLKEGVYGKDGKYIYYKGDIIEEIDYKTFEVLDFRYIKDKNHVFSYGKKIENADVSSFKVFSGSDPEFQNVKIDVFYDSMDKNNYYLNGNVVKKK